MENSNEKALEEGAKFCEKLEMLFVTEMSQKYEVEPEVSLPVFLENHADKLSPHEYALGAHLEWMWHDVCRSMTEA